MHVKAPPLGDTGTLERGRGEHEDGTCQTPSPGSIPQAPASQGTALGLADEPLSHKVVLFHQLLLCWAPE